jgi:hypothetical protein
MSRIAKAFQEGTHNIAKASSHCLHARGVGFAAYIRMGPQISAGTDTTSGHSRRQSSAISIRCFEI